MGQIQVRALQKCFVCGSLRKVGDVFNVPVGTVLRTKKRPPVMELVDENPGRSRGKGGKFKKGKAAKAEAEEPAED